MKRGTAWLHHTLKKSAAGELLPDRSHNRRSSFQEEGKKKRGERICVCFCVCLCVCVWDYKNVPTHKKANKNGGRNEEGNTKEVRKQVEKIKEVNDKLRQDL